MGFPTRFITINAAAAAVFLALRQPEFSRLTFVGNFVAVWLFQVLPWAIWSTLLYPKLFSPLIGLPEPTGNHWLMGQYGRIIAEPSGAPARDWVNNIPNEGVIRYKGFMNQERLLITSPKLLAEVLVTHNYDFQKPGQMRQSIGRILGNGILFAEGEEHRWQRKHLMPAFAFRHIKDLYPIFWRKARECVQTMTEQFHAPEHVQSERGEVSQLTTDSEKGTNLGKDTIFIEVGNWASRATLDIVGIAGMGRDFGAIRNPENELNRTYRSILKPSRQARILGLLHTLLPWWIVNNLPVKRNDDIVTAVRVIRATCYDLIREKKEKLARKELSDVDILSVSLESGLFSDDNLVDQLMTFLAAGHETTASAMTWAIYMLCLHPDVQTRLRQEVRERLPSIEADVDVTSLDIDHMPYLNAVCNEVLRYYSPVPLTIREAATETMLLNRRVPKGTRIILAPWATNKDQTLWGPDAGRFNPDRWIPQSETDKTAGSGGATSNYAFMSFLHGPRSCIGQGFAKAEFACLLAAWIGRFEFSLKNEEEHDEKNMLIKGGITARPANGLHVKAKVLEGW